MSVVCSDCFSAIQLHTATPKTRPGFCSSWHTNLNPVFARTEETEWQCHGTCAVKSPVLCPPLSKGIQPPLSFPGEGSLKDEGH